MIEKCSARSSRSASLGVCPLVPVLFREERRDHPRPDVLLPRPMRRDVESPAQHGHHDLHVVRIRKVVHADGRVNGGVGACKDDLAFATRQHRICEHQDAVASAARRSDASSKSTGSCPRVGTCATTSLCSRRENRQSVHRDCLDRRRQSRTRLRHRTATRRQGSAPVVAHSVVRRSASCLRACSSAGRFSSSSGSVGRGPPGWRRAAGPIEIATSLIGTPALDAGRTTEPVRDLSDVGRRGANRPGRGRPQLPAPFGALCRTGSGVGRTDCSGAQDHLLEGDHDADLAGRDSILDALGIDFAG